MAKAALLPPIRSKSIRHVPCVICMGTRYMGSSALRDHCGGFLGSAPAVSWGKRCSEMYRQSCTSAKGPTLGPQRAPAPRTLVEPTTGVVYEKWRSPRNAKREMGVGYSMF